MATNGKSAEIMAPAAKKAVEAWVNPQECQSADDVLRALDALAAMALQAVMVVRTGKSEVVQ